MIRNLIFDFVGVIADVDHKKVLKDLTFAEKIKTLRLVVSHKRGKAVKELFDAYQAGEISTAEFDLLLQRSKPSYKGLVTKLSKSIESNLQVNEDVISLIDQLRKDDFKVYMLSNSTPETEKIIEENNLRQHFDGLVLSTELGLLKPDESIFEYTAEKYSLKPIDTLFIDDTDENLATAQYFGFKTLKSSSSQETFHQVGRRFYSLYQQFAKQQKEEPEKE